MQYTGKPLTGIKTKVLSLVLHGLPARKKKNIMHNMPWLGLTIPGTVLENELVLLRPGSRDRTNRA